MSKRKRNRRSTAKMNSATTHPSWKPLPRLDDAVARQANAHNVSELHKYTFGDDVGSFAHLLRLDAKELEAEFYRDAMPYFGKDRFIDCLLFNVDENLRFPCNWEQVTANLESYAELALFPAMDVHFRTMRDRIRDGETTALRVDTPEHRALWYSMLVPTSHQNDYTIKDWERDVDGSPDFPVERIGDSEQCAIWMFNKTLGGRIAVPIDEFFSLKHLRGQSVELQDTLGPLWTIATLFRIAS